MQIKCTIPELLEFQTPYTHFVDEILQNKVDANLNLNYQTNTSINDVLDQNSNETLLDFLYKNCSIELDWETSEFISPLK